MKNENKINEIIDVLSGACQIPRKYIEFNDDELEEVLDKVITFYEDDKNESKF